MLKAVSLSRQGEKSDNNEDACLALPSIGVVAIADGVGGNPNGEFASRALVETLHTELNGKTVSKDLIVEAIKEANKLVFANNEGLPKGKGMATTLVLAWISNGLLTCFGVGDSRIYRLRDDRLEQLTKDHVKSVLVGSRTKNMVTKVVGAGSDVEPHVTEWDWKSEDVLLLCSDGISDQLSDDEIYKVVTYPNLGMSDKASILIDESIKKGGRDDKTVILAF